ncbi:MAG: ATP-binding protein, partial [Chloroflexota bacterium]|nr:ATP-binding protein [Chloroflexota bacterium]
SKISLRFFWQLITAFVLVIILVWGGMLLAGRAALNRMARDEVPATSLLWIDRLAGYYGERGSWEQVETMIAEYPCGSAWGPWDENWYVDYVLAAPDGAILSASDDERLGQTLDHWELGRAAPIVVDDQRVGLLLLSQFGHFRPGPPSVLTRALQGFLLAGLAVGAGSLVVGLVLSRGMSRPLVSLTDAARAVAAGDLSARVPVRYRGEVRELAVAFNQMTEDLARADELRRNMTADVAHELRTPLSVIRGKLEGVLDGVYPATSEHLEPVLEEAELLTHLVEDLRLLALAEAGQLTLEKRPLDVGDLLRDAQVNFGPQADDRGVTLALDLPPELPQAMADWRRIAQVLGNLLTNALRHTPEGGCVTMSAAVSSPLVGDIVEVTVADTGAGISPDDLPNVFERFWRGEKSRSRAGGGSGLGLAIARQLVEAHGGTIGVESAPGEGARFWFTLLVVG